MDEFPVFVLLFLIFPNDQTSYIQSQVLVGVLTPSSLFLILKSVIHAKSNYGSFLIASVSGINHRKLNVILASYLWSIVGVLRLRLWFIWKWNAFILR